MVCYSLRERVCVSSESASEVTGAELGVDVRPNSGTSADEVSLGGFRRRSLESRSGRRRSRTKSDSSTAIITGR
jgi:hypothetical protein